MIKFIVEHKPLDQNPIRCDSAEEAIEKADQVGGMAWKVSRRTEKSGLPVTSYKKWCKDSKTWEPR